VVEVVQVIAAAGQQLAALEVAAAAIEGQHQVEAQQELQGKETLGVTIVVNLVVAVVALEPLEARPAQLQVAMAGRVLHPALMERQRLELEVAAAGANPPPGPAGPVVAAMGPQVTL
jgi:hypothetical protein